MNAPNKEPQGVDQQNLSLMLKKREVLLYVYRQMLIVAYAKMKNKADALDIVQESWIKILKKWDHLRDPEKLVQWAKVIVSNTANSAIRRKVVYQEILREHAATITTNLQESTEDAHWEREEIFAYLSELEEDTRLMFLLKYYYDWKDREIAAELKMPVGTVKARIHRGKKWLRNRLQQNQDFIE